jgi:diguanylate cyclase (GGDEF)-like protein/PAS domain S-box-containing protein
VTMYLVGGLLAPALTGLFAAAVISLIHHRAFASGWLQWTAAHGLGFLAIFPFAGLIVGARARGEALTPNSRRLPSIAMLLLIAGVGFVCFGQTRLPLLFLPVMVMMYATLLCDLAVSAAGLLMLLIIAGAMTLAGHGPITFVGPDQSLQFYFLQAYFACLALTTAPVAVLQERRRRLFANLAESEARYRVLADFSTDIIMVTDLKGRIRFVSPSITQLGSYEPERMIDTSAREIIAPEFHAAVDEAYISVLENTHTTANVEFLGITAGQHLRWFESHLRAVVRADGTVDGVCSVIRDIAHRKRREAELHAAALTDPLTQLANRRAFDLFVAPGIPGQSSGFVALFDLDHFKRINDGLGHDCGDRVLKAFARAARAVLRDDDVPARIGGEEFAVFLAGTTEAQARLICARLTRMLATEAAKEVPPGWRVTASVGLSPLDGPLDEVLKRADVALYSAKAAGRDRLAMAA